jgi:hypothetical protein
LSVPIFFFQLILNSNIFFDCYALVAFNISKMEFTMKLSPVFLMSLAFMFVISLVACDDDSKSSDNNSNNGFELLQQEEDVLYYTNYVRTDPAGFAQEFLQNAYDNGNDNGAYEDLMSRTPCDEVVLHEDLMAAADAHSNDMADNCGMQHDSCDGTSFSDRLWSYFSGSSIGENIAWGYTDGLEVVKAWIIDHGIPNLGHRENILECSWQYMGISYVDTYWTQDFGRD